MQRPETHSTAVPCVHVRRESALQKYPETPSKVHVLVQHGKPDPCVHARASAMPAGSRHVSGNRFWNAWSPKDALCFECHNESPYNS